MPSAPGRRAVIVAGLRTPFAKAGTALREVSAVDLARHCTRELLYRTELSGSHVDQVIMGQVIQAGVGQAPDIIPRQHRPPLPPAKPGQHQEKAHDDEETFTGHKKSSCRQASRMLAW